MKDLCKGCKSNNDIKTKGSCIACNIPKILNTTICPCVTCLVKAMCVRPCKEYESYANRVYMYYGVDNRCKGIKKEKV